MSLPSEVDVAIIGAGAAGLGAAHALKQSNLSFIVLEARDRVGGRAHTIQPAPEITFDLGCGWLHSADENEWTRIAPKLGFAVDDQPPPWARPAHEANFPAAEQKDYWAAWEERRREKLGPKLPAAITRAYGTESAEGNLCCDLMLAAQPAGANAEIALTNGGGLRADIPAGELTYGGLFEAMPFDNRFAIVDVKGSHLRSMVSTNLQRGGGILSWGGLTAKAAGSTLRR